MKNELIKKQVRKSYGKIAVNNSSCCCSSSCCGGDEPGNISKNIGYTENNLKEVPEGANLGLGCGNPTALASLKEGETVLDIGSGAGFDCFIAANKVGGKGKVIGVDMTPEMVKKAKANAKKSNYTNVDFRLGEIEKLPVDNNSIDVVISNCVINLVPDKGKAFKEILRVLKPGGRMLISDIVLKKELPVPIKKSVEAYVGCVSGAILRNKYLDLIKESGFDNVKIVDETIFPIEFLTSDPTIKAIIINTKIPIEEITNIGSSVLSIKVCGTKPR